jgi:hypothetical protein
LVLFHTKNRTQARLASFVSPRKRIKKDTRVGFSAQSEFSKFG